VWINSQNYVMQEKVLENLNLEISLPLYVVTETSRMWVMELGDAQLLLLKFCREG
jgi:hypothetical protein